MAKKDTIVDPKGLAKVLKASGLSKEEAAKVIAANDPAKPVVGQGAAELPTINQL